MKILLDTHVAIWAVLDSKGISIAKEQDLYDDDFDEMNPEIEKIFGA